MIKHNLVQGSAEWLAYRKNYNNASDAPAMMGVSAYKTRTELLNERKSGIAPDVSSATQKLFDMGHRAEFLARPLAEKIIGEELSPEIASLGNLSASFDGITFMGDIIFEHKALNAKIRACETTVELDLQYKVQMEQQLYISKAEKCLFMATKWDANGDLIDSIFHWYYPDLELRQRIIDGWVQFEKDVLSITPSVQVVEMPKAEVTLDLPALFVHAKGEITTSNMKEYGEALAVRLADVRKIELITDQDFSNAKQAAKMFREQIKKNIAAEEAMLSQTVSVGEASRIIKAWNEDLRITALKLEKDVESEDLAKKRSMISDAHLEYRAHLDALNLTIRPLDIVLDFPDFSLAIKGKSKFTAMQDAIDTMLANAKIEADKVQKMIMLKARWMDANAADYFFLFPHIEMQQIIYKPMDDFQLLVNTRVAEHKKLEAEKEAKIKAQAEVDAIAKVEAEKEEPLKLGKEMKEIKTTQKSVNLEPVDLITSFFNLHKVNPNKHQEYRAVITEYLKHVGEFKERMAA